VLMEKRFPRAFLFVFIPRSSSWRHKNAFFLSKSKNAAAPQIIPSQCVLKAREI
jgi:hypothetical protein